MDAIAPYLKCWLVKFGSETGVKLARGPEVEQLGNKRRLTES